MAPLPGSPSRRARPASTTSSNKVVLRDSRAMRAALNRLSYLRTRPASAINPAYYAALRDARARANPPSPPSIRRRRKTNKENPTTSTSTPSATRTVNRPRVDAPPVVTTVAHAPWMRQPLSSASSSPNVSFVSTPAERSTLSAGSRAPRAKALTTKELWVGGLEPPPRDPITTPHQECVVCKQVKTCPVISGCGHSHCYPCIRVALEYSFRCPSCRAIMTSAPFRCWAEEQCIAHDHPDWNNTSRVVYDFDGIEFPRLM
ncbi:hypothetical protein DFH06DRAFT_1341731 [Mycena polygramma]|nr:hypothetical protein DFH06DRAFT_1353545 [Mycena polygramma]KAJ7620613.1 hypothetical protein DFH06DRAFT_1341731 [Mycena polygramma]